MDADSGKWTTIRRVEAFCRVEEEGDWAKASRALRGSGTDSRIAVHLVEGFAEDLRPGSAPTLFEPVPLDERERAERRVRLTETGRQVLPLAKDLLAAARSLRNVLHQNSGPLRIACYPAHVRKVIVLLRAKGNLEVDVIEADDAHRVDGGKLLFERLSRHEVDAVIAPVRRERRIARKPLYPWELRAAFRRGHPLSTGDGPVSARDLAGEALLLSPSGHTSREIVDRVLSRAGVEPRVFFESHSTESLLAYVDQGLGVAILPEDALWPAGSRRVLRPFAPDETVQHALHWRSGEHQTDSRMSALLIALQEIGFKAKAE